MKCGIYNQLNGFKYFNVYLEHISLHTLSLARAITWKKDHTTFQMRSMIRWGYEIAGCISGLTTIQ